MKLAHLGHAHLHVADLAASKAFFTETMGLTVTDEGDGVVYLRAWQDWEHHTLSLRQAQRSAVHHVGFRVEDPPSLEEFARRFDELNLAYEWVPRQTEPGQGEAIRFATPGGFPLELYWEMKQLRFTDSVLGSTLPSFPQKVPTVGIGPRRVDHVNVLANDVAGEQGWLEQVLGFKHRYYAEGEDGNRLASWMSVTNLSHDIAVMRNRTGAGPRLHHFAYYVDSPDEVLRAATVLVEHGGRIEWGPGKHATSGATYLYFFEPSGHRMELWTGGMLIFAPDWAPIRWDRSVEAYGFNMWGTPAPDTFLTQGMEPVGAPVTAR
jgi:catechol 2,3-dioxygenase